MLTLLPTLKLRLAIPDTDTTQDALLTSAIQAVSARFDKETNRTLARTENFTQEFDIGSTEIVAACYPTPNSASKLPPSPQSSLKPRNTSGTWSFYPESQ